MKKIAIIVAVILTTAVTAFSLTRNENKAEIAKMNSEKAAVSSQSATTTTNRIATAD